MFRRRSTLESRDRESGLVFSWRVPLSSAGSMALAVFLEVLVVLAVAVALAVFRVVLVGLLGVFAFFVASFAVPRVCKHLLVQRLGGCREALVLSMLGGVYGEESACGFQHRIRFQVFQRITNRHRFGDSAFSGQRTHHTAQLVVVSFGVRQVFFGV